jgi:hypothetical protein
VASETPERRRFARSMTLLLLLRTSITVVFGFIDVLFQDTKLSDIDS